VTPATPLLYEPSLFLGRDHEIRAVIGALDGLVAGVQGPRIVIFRGSRGHGKTWLSLHLQRTVLPDWQQKHPATKIMTVWVGLDEDPERAYGVASERELYFFPQTRSHSTPEDLTQKLLDHIAEQLDALRTPDAGYAQTQWIIDALKSRGFGSDNSKSQYLVLLLDSVFETDWVYLREIERTLLAPLSELPNVLLVLTGRGPDYPWNTARFRDIPPTILGPFSISDSYLRDQLETQVFNQLEISNSEKQRVIRAVEQYSRGYPLNNWLIAQSLLDPETWETHLQQLLDAYPRLTQHDKAAIKGLSILSPETRFREEEVAILGSVVAGVELSGRFIRQQLYASNVIRWDQGGWVVEESLAAFYNAVLYLNESEYQLCVQLHQTAIGMYRSWQREEDSQELFDAELHYHRQRLGNLAPELLPASE